MGQKCLISIHTEFEGDSLEKNIDQYVRRLLELDSTAVELQFKREAEIAEMEAQYNAELEKLDAYIAAAAAQARKRHSERIAEAEAQVKILDDQMTERLQKLEAAFEAFKPQAAKAIWEQLLNMER